MEDENVSRYKDRPKNPRRGVQTAPEHESAFGAIGPIRHFWSAKQHSKRAKFSCDVLWPNSLLVTIGTPFSTFLQKDASRFKP